MIKLDIFSDPVCPWCYIGKTYLDWALEASPDHPFTVEWHPFQLNPDMPEDGMDRADYLAAKFGGRDRAASVYAGIEQAAREAGIEIDFSRIERTPNTLDAHRLIHWAGLEGRQTPVVSALFRAYFREGRDIGSPAVLGDIAAASGLDRPMIERLLDSDADAEELRARDAHARSRGINAVPTFIVANQYALAGAQRAELWRDVIAELAQTVAAGTAEEPTEQATQG